MKRAFPIVLTPDNGGFLVYSPDLDINTYGESLEDALFMAKDAISLVCLCLEDDDKKIPEVETFALNHAENEIVIAVEVDLAEYRKKNDTKATRKNVTIPTWMNTLVEEKNINCSQLLQKAIKQELNL